MKIKPRPRRTTTHLSSTDQQKRWHKSIISHESLLKRSFPQWSVVLMNLSHSKQMLVCVRSALAISKVIGSLMVALKWQSAMKWFCLMCFLSLSSVLLKVQVSVNLTWYFQRKRKQWYLWMFFAWWVGMGIFPPKTTSVTFYTVGQTQEIQILSKVEGSKAIL